MHRSIRVVSAFLAACAVGALARSVIAGDESGSALKPERFDLSDLEASAAATGPTIFVASDAVAQEGMGEGTTVEKLLAFQEPPFPGHALSPDVAMDVLRRLVPGFNTEPGWSVRAAGSTLQVRATEAGVKRATDAIAYIRGALASRIPAMAVLSAVDGRQTPPRAIAVGAASLAARRWTPVYFHRADKRFTIDYDVEVAQEAESNDPRVAALPEGAELYLRYDPGESVSIVEVWAGAADHLEPRTVDLSGIRNVPESNTMGKIDQPRTTVRRAFTAVSVPSGAPSTVEFAWESNGSSRILKLTFGAVTPVPPDREAGRHPLAILRAAALTSKLEKDMREPSLDAWIDGLKDAAGSAAEELTTETYGEAFVACEGPAAVLATARESLVKGEAALAGASVELRAVAVPEPRIRAALESGGLTLGTALSADQVASLIEPDAVSVASVRTPVTPRVPAEVTVGASETFLGGFDVEIAQSSGALNPVVMSRFAGLAGTVRLSNAEGGGATVRFSGALTWVKADGSTIDMPFRPPVGVEFNNRDSGRPEDPAVRRFSFPIGSTGEARAQADATFTPDAVKSARPAILAVLSRGGGDGLPDTVLLLVTVRR